MWKIERRKTVWFDVSSFPSIVQLAPCITLCNFLLCFALLSNCIYTSDWTIATCCALAWLRLFCQNELRIYFLKLLRPFRIGWLAKVKLPIQKASHGYKVRTIVWRIAHERIEQKRAQHCDREHLHWTHKCMLRIFTERFHQIKPARMCVAFNRKGQTGNRKNRWRRRRRTKKQHT